MPSIANKSSGVIQLAGQVYGIGALVVSLYWVFTDSGLAAVFTSLQANVFGGRYYPILSWIASVLTLFSPVVAALFLAPLPAESEGWHATSTLPCLHCGAAAGTGWTRNAEVAICTACVGACLNILDDIHPRISDGQRFGDVSPNASTTCTHCGSAACRALCGGGQSGICDVCLDGVSHVVGRPSAMGTPRAVIGAQLGACGHASVTFAVSPAVVGLPAPMMERPQATLLVGNQLDPPAPVRLDRDHMRTTVYIDDAPHIVAVPWGAVRSVTASHSGARVAEFAEG